MKKKNNKTVSILYYLIAVCFYIVSIINFRNGDEGMGVVYICLGSSFVCLGSVWSNKDKNDRIDDK